MALPKRIPEVEGKKRRRIPPLPSIEKENVLNDNEDSSIETLSVESMEEDAREEQRQDEDLDAYIQERENALEEARRIKEEEAKEEERRSVSKSNHGRLEFDDPFEEGTDTSTNETFINEKELKIEPTGGKKSKRRKGGTARAKDFDDRTNKLTAVKVLRFFVFVVILGLFLFGVKNTFFPSHVYTKEDITLISQRAVGQTGFPMNRGRAFAEQFTEAYLTVDSGNDNARKTLDHFYGGRESAQGAEVSWSGKNNQKILVQPKVFSEQGITENIGYYYVSTLVSDREGNSVDANGKVSSKWVALAVTVYFNSKTQELSIAKDSPQIIPSFEVSSGSQLPQGTPIGTGSSNSELYDAMKSTINGYLKAYAASSTKSHSDADQYVKDSSDPSVFAGFGGEMTINTDQLSSQNVAIYPSTDSPENNEWKVDLQLQWEDATSTSLQDQLTYKGRYIMTVEKNKDGKYFVTAFRPYIYTPKEEASE